MLNIYIKHVSSFMNEKKNKLNLYIVFVFYIFDFPAKTYSGYIKMESLYKKYYFFYINIEITNKKI